MDAPGFEYAGWWLVTRVPPGAAPPPFSIRATTSDGRARVVAVDPASARRLPPRTGPEWTSLGADVAAAEQQGAADRVAALARRQPGDTARAAAPGVDDAGALQ
jgi:hypothetical protein